MLSVVREYLHVIKQGTMQFNLLLSTAGEVFWEVKHNSVQVRFSIMIFLLYTRLLNN